MGKSIFAKIKKRIIKILHRFIYHNYRYKPVGIFIDSVDYLCAQPEQVSNYIEIYPGLVSTLTISEELYANCSDYMRPLLSVKTTYIIVEIAKGRIHTDNADSVAVISANNKLIGDISFNYKNSKIVSPKQNNIFKQRYFEKPDLYTGTVFTLLTGGSGINNYFHWLVDTLPRIHLLKQSGLFNKIDYFLIPSYKYKYQKDTLRLLDINPDKIIEADKHPHITADTIIASTAPRGNFSIIPQWVCGFLQDSFLKKGLSQKTTPFIYISRRDSTIRHILNEEALIRLLNFYGFKTFVLGELSFEEQVNLFASAQVIVSPHGAGLINLAFCNKGTKVLEIFSDGYVKATYHDLSRKTGLDYYHIICKNNQYTANAKQGMKLDIIVDLPSIADILDNKLMHKPKSLLSTENIES